MRTLTRHFFVWDIFNLTRFTKLLKYNYYPTEYYEEMPPKPKKGKIFTLVIFQGIKSIHLRDRMLDFWLLACEQIAG